MRGSITRIRNRIVYCLGYGQTKKEALEATLIPYWEHFLESPTE